MKLQEIVDALRAVRDVETNHKGLLALRRQLHRSRPASDQLLCAYLQQSPACSELQAIWDVQVTAKEPKVTLELLGCLAALLAYSPSSSCEAAARQRITTGLDLLAGAILQRRLKQVYFLLSSNNRQRSNAALDLLTALAGRGGSTLRELCAAFDFSLSVLPKLARPPRLAGNGGGLQESGGLAGKGGGEGQQQQQQVPAHWEMWASPAVGRRPSRAVFVEWGFFYVGLFSQATSAAHASAAAHLDSIMLSVSKDDAGGCDNPTCTDGSIQNGDLSDAG
ncbi:hypothetical protein OEZ85_002062 [Tetradesmus obliquus]|uniref:URB1 N-terminal domain-containing protein n=1 Tax=Tetradesmus obliquus TaxID=3088 RepID=A0ABY8U5Z6_TETOB|nr:hypothetical protein OEZ85_002062 [Tetradesmus obliquus]